MLSIGGKKNDDLKIPLNNSISMTIDSLYTITSVEDSEKDIFIINGKEENNERIKNYLNLFRNKFNKKDFLKIVTENNFPTSAGIASSASGFSALAFALDKYWNLNLSKKDLSILSRLGSGSACRSIYGGFVEWSKGNKDDGSDSYSIQIADKDYWKEIRMIIAIVEDNKKVKSSSDGMSQTVKTSPFYNCWLSSIENDLVNVRNAILERDIEKLGKTIEHNCLKMHATMITTIPSVIYWRAGTLKVIEKVNEIRNNGYPCYYTIDAGPNVKIICEEKDLLNIKQQIENLKDIKKIMVSKCGDGPTFLED
ncbi:MAG: diphosphomevalonate decarboxylase [Candidatus Sericytochromatia bacterium]|nr:MAG: diphosphomevalonate decarboxylase [Candidatus Sericytochromatia bacterium]